MAFALGTIYEDISKILRKHPHIVFMSFGSKEMTITKPQLKKIRAFDRLDSWVYPHNFFLSTTFQIILIKYLDLILPP